jgi:F-type H+-transporting ATPase subunit alpha
LQEVLKQPQFQPLSLEKQVMILFAGARGILDDIPPEKVPEFERQFYTYMEATHPDIGSSIRDKLEILPEVEAKLEAAVREFKATFSA